MKKHLQIILVLLLCQIILICSTHNIDHHYHPHNEEYISSINEKQKTWTAGKNSYFQGKNFKTIQGLLGTMSEFDKPDSELLKFRPDMYIAASLPDSFDARKTWSSCQSIQEIHDQAYCGSCWAQAAAEVISDRICIQSNQSIQIQISVEDLLSCCWSCGFGCVGGWPSVAWSYYESEGIVTGGNYNSSQSWCMDYSIPPCNHYNASYATNSDLEACPNYNAQTPSCKKKCSLNYNQTYENDKNYAASVYRIHTDISAIQTEIMTNGPVQTSFTIFCDFLTYTSGVYVPTTEEVCGYHSVKIIGWGVDNDVPYWLIANSWNKYWGENGFFKVYRGNNTCDIESVINAGTVILPSNPPTPQCSKGQVYSDTLGACIYCGMAMPGCQECSSTTSCIKCSLDMNYHLTSQNTCQQCCPDEFWNWKIQECTKCYQAMPNCWKCDSSQTCDVCVNQTVLVNGQCGSPPQSPAQCTSVQYFNTTLQACQYCSSLVSNCLNCNSQGACTTCQSGYFLINSTCQLKPACGSNTFWDDIQNLCILCNASISNCYGCESSSICTSCQSGYQLVNSSSCNQVQPSCPQNSYWDSQQQTCIQCSQKIEFCMSCISSDTCLTCTSGFSLKNVQCVQISPPQNKTVNISCPAGYYWDVQQLSCINCSQKVQYCASCSSYDVCLSCQSGYTIYQNWCVYTAGCPQGQFYDVNEMSCYPMCTYGSTYSINSESCQQTCNFTIDHCTACVDDTFCTACEEGYELTSDYGSCIYVPPTNSQCPIQQTWDSSSSSCVDCSSHIPFCSGCSSLSLCESCETGYQLAFNNYACIQVGDCPQNQFYDPKQMSCVQSCPAGQYWSVNNLACTQCSSALANCDICFDKYKCLKCNSNYNLSSDYTTCIVSSGNNILYQS